MDAGVDLRLAQGGVERVVFAEAHGDVLADGHRIEQGGELKDVADAGAQADRTGLAGEIGDVQAVDDDLAAVGHEEPDDMFDGDGLAGAGEADEGDGLAFLDVEREVAEDVFGAEGLIDVPEGDHAGRLGARLRGEAAECAADLAFAEALEGAVPQLAHALAGDAEHGADLL